MYLVSGVVCVHICKHAVSYLFGVLLAVSQCLKRSFKEIRIIFCCVAFSPLFSEVSEEEYGVMRLTI